ncbi:ADP-ribosylglycohydrolase family protein [Sporolactobacillus sp. Y61]|uniref:ADP-ribosylglycohydrolase family protein n=1 Tax=Sporolactobacillus sp. Y61 TaxID=3160863 RepID=A0AAU8IGQ9_9BACL
MIGAMIGDIAGSRFTADDNQGRDFELFTDDCRLTDSSLLMFAVARALMDTVKAKKPSTGGTYDDEFLALLESLMLRNVKNISRLSPQSGSGKSLSDQVNGETPEIDSSFGNGAVLSVIPAGFAARTDMEAICLAEAVTETIPLHHEGIKDGEAVAVAVFMARRGFTKSEIYQKVNQNYFPLDFTLDGIREVNGPDETSHGIVPQAIEVFLESVSFDDAIRTAVSLGGDRGIRAAITGALAEAYYGVSDSIVEKAVTYLDQDRYAVYHEWSRFIGRSTGNQFRVLTKYIGKLSAVDSFGGWFIGSKYAGTPEFPIPMPDIYFNHLVDSFIREFCQFSDSHPAYALTEYSSILENHGLKWDSEVMRHAGTDSLDAQCILALIMGAIRAKQFCDGALFDFFQDGSMVKWLKQLKSIDRRLKSTQIEEICFDIGGFFSGWHTYRMVFENGRAILTTDFMRDPSATEHYSREETAQLMKTFEDIHVEYWESEYTDPGVLDGTQWKLAVNYGGQRDEVWSGSNAYPPNWRDLLHFFDIDDDADSTVNIRKMTIEFDRHRHFDASFSPQGVNWHDTESITIDHERQQLVIRQRAGMACSVTHQYDVQGGMDDLLRVAEDCFHDDGWVDTPKFDDTTGVRFYKLEAIYYDGTVRSHSGIYNRRHIPEESWSELMDLIRWFIGFYGFGQLLDRNAFMNARKDGEVKYCSVAFDDSDRTYYYQTDDEGIEVGDYVRVPFGASNMEGTARVESIDYFPIEEVPFPLEKTKKIIGRVQEQ